MFSLDLDVHPLLDDAINYIENLPDTFVTGTEVMDIIDTHASLRGRKTSEYIPYPPLEHQTCRVVVIHHAGRALPEMYGVPYRPNQTTLDEMAMDLASLVDLERNERFIWGWCSFKTYRSSGSILDATDVVPLHTSESDYGVNFQLTAWRVPVADSYFMVDCLLGDTVGSFAPPIFLASMDLTTFQFALRPFVSPTHIETILHEAVCVPNPNPLTETGWRRMAVVLNDDVARIPYLRTKQYTVHTSAAATTLLSEWKHAGKVRHSRERIEMNSASHLRQLVRRLNTPTSHRFKLQVVDSTTLRLHMDVAIKHSSIVPRMDDVNTERWAVALYVAEQFQSSSGSSYNTFLTLLEIEDGTGCALQPLTVQIALKPHQLQNLQRMRHIEQNTTLATTLLTQCSATAWWDPRTNWLGDASALTEISGGFLCDSVGLGKTLSMIALCVENPPPTESFNTLILCTPSVLVQWKREIERYSSLKVLEYYGKKKRDVTREMMRTYDVVLTTYATYLQSDIFTYTRGQLNPIQWHRVVYDESHAMSYRCTRHESMVRARNRWCVTATPFHNLDRQFRALGIPSRIYEPGFATLYYILEPLMIRHTQNHVVDELPPLTIEEVAVQFETQEEHVAYTHAFQRVKQNIYALRNGTGMSSSDVLRVQMHIHALRDMCTVGVHQEYQPLVFPPVDYTLVAPHEDDDMCPVCMNMFEQPMLTTCNHWFCSDCIGTALNFCPKCPMCRNPQTLGNLRAGVLFGQTPPETNAMDIDPTPRECSSKLVHLFQMLKTMREGDATSKAIVFCESSSTIPLIMTALKAAKIKARCIHGAMAANQRGNAIKAFQEDSNTVVFVSSIRSAAAGINLTAANHIFFTGPILNPANYTQAIGRAHRTGQMRPVTVHTLYMEGTIEEKLRAPGKKWTFPALCSVFD